MELLEKQGKRKLTHARGDSIVWTLSSGSVEGRAITDPLPKSEQTLRVLQGIILKWSVKKEQDKKNERKKERKKEKGPFKM